MPISELMNRTDALKARTTDFAIRIFHLVEALPKSLQGRAVANQIIRSGTSVAANYRAACRARAKREVIAKLGTVEEEADDSAFWLELIIETGLLPITKLKPLLREADEIVSIMAASRKSAIANRQSAIR